MKFGQRIKEARISKGLTQKELSGQANISVPYLSSLENDRDNNPSLRLMQRIGSILETSPSYLFFNEGEVRSFNDTVGSVFTANKMKKCMLDKGISKEELIGENVTSYSLTLLLRNREINIYKTSMEEIARKLERSVDFLFFQKEGIDSEYRRYLNRKIFVPDGVSEEVKKIIEVQDERGYTDTYVAEKTNVSQTFIHRLKTGKKGVDKPFVEYDYVRIKRIEEFLEI
jgi:XRE family transcriptional regulator of biofilm formation